MCGVKKMKRVTQPSEVAEEASLRRAHLGRDRKESGKGLRCEALGQERDRPVRRQAALGGLKSNYRGRQWQTVADGGRRAPAGAPLGRGAAPWADPGLRLAGADAAEHRKDGEQQKWDRQDFLTAWP